MKVQEFTKEQIISFFRNHWKPVGLGGLILAALIITLLIPEKEKNATTIPGQGTANNTSSNSDSSKKSSNPFSFLFGSDKKETPTPTVDTSSVKPPPNSTSQAGQSTITKVLPNGTKTTQTVTGSTVNTTQGSINPNTNIASDLSSNTQQDILSIVFQNPDGTTFTYIPPGTPPDEVRWGRYTNTVSNYAINFPVNWQFVYSIDGNGNEGIALYPPGANPSDSNSPYIGFGITDSFLLPVAGETTNAYITHIVADGIQGDLYTNGPMGNSYIASVLSYSGKYFGLGASKSDATFAYVYYYMLHSLTFNIE